MVSFYKTADICHTPIKSDFLQFHAQKDIWRQAPPGPTSAGRAYCILPRRILRIVRTCEGRKSAN